MWHTPLALSLLLSYPTEQTQLAADELFAELAANPALLPARPALAQLARELAANDLLDTQEAWVGLFDRTRSLSLHLFEHVHGEGRERGPAMVELADLYAQAGLDPSAHELPDYLPMLLEFTAAAPDAGRELLAKAAPLIDLLHGRLATRGSAYAAVLHATLLLAGAAASHQLPPPEPEQTPEELDRTWQEAEVLFGPGADPGAECGGDALAAKLRAARCAPNPNPRRPVLRRVPATQG